MWFFLVKSIVGAIVGQSTNTWFKKTKMGMWFYKKMDHLPNRSTAFQAEYIFQPDTLGSASFIAR